MPYCCHDSGCCYADTREEDNGVVDDDYHHACVHGQQHFSEDAENEGKVQEALSTALWVLRLRFRGLRGLWGSLLQAQGTGGGVITGLYKGFLG